MQTDFSKVEITLIFSCLSRLSVYKFQLKAIPPKTTAAMRGTNRIPRRPIAGELHTGQSTRGSIVKAWSTLYCAGAAKQILSSDLGCFHCDSVFLKILNEVTQVLAVDVLPHHPTQFLAQPSQSYIRKAVTLDLWPSQIH